jgi:hypothetical protein
MEILNLHLTNLRNEEHNKFHLDVVRGSAITDELANAGRDATFSGLEGTIKSELNHFNPGVRAAAARLQKLFDTYGNLALKPYDQKTSAIYKLVDDLQVGYSVDATTVGIAGCIDKINGFNN